MKQRRIQIVYMRLDQLIPNPSNPRVNDEAVEYIMSSIQAFGMRCPIIIDKFDGIVAGHTRYKACARLHISHVPCVMADDLSPKQLKAYMLADNKTGQKAQWNTYMLQAQMDALEGLIDMEQFGFKQKKTKQSKEEPFESEKEDGTLACPHCGCTFTKEQAKASVWK